METKALLNQMIRLAGELGFACVSVYAPNEDEVLAIHFARDEDALEASVKDWVAHAGE